MSDSEDPELEEELQAADELLQDMQNDAQSEPQPRPVRWKKRDRQGDFIPQRPSTSRSTTCMPRVSRDQHQCPREETSYVTSVNPTKVYGTEVLRQELLQLLEDGEEDAAMTCETSSESAATHWAIRNMVSSQKWKEARPCLIDNMLATLDPQSHRVCQCGKQVVVRCLDCLPLPFLCADCDIAVHTRFVLHNREAVTGGFLQPSSEFHKPIVRLLPVQRPDHVCDCPAGNVEVSPGSVVALVTINGRYNLALPVVRCTSCGLMWSPSVKDILGSGYWPGTLNFCTLFSMDVFQSFYDIKKAAPGMSLKAFVKMLDERTAHFGRTGRISADAFSKSFLEWSAVKFEVDRMCKEPCFSCPACTPDMLAVSVDGNRKLYRFQSNASTSEQANFEGVFIEKDEDVAEFVKYIQRHTSHRKLAANVPGHITFLCSDVACKYFPYLTKVAQQCPELRNLLSMRPFLSVMHAKAHTWKCEIKWGGAFQDGAGSTVGEEVEQVNRFLSRAAITTKYMSKAGRTDMLTLLALGWNKRKVEQLGRTLSQRYLKIIRILREQVESLNATKNELGVDDDTLQQWVADVQKWAEETDQTDGSLGALQARIEELVVIIRVRTQSLYRQNDSNKSRHRIRKVILVEKKRLAAAVDDYNKLAEPTKQIVSSDALIQTDIWPWQSTSEPAADLQTKRKVFEKVMAVRRLREEEMILCREMWHHWTVLRMRSVVLGTISSDSSLVGMSEDAQKGLCSLVLKKQSELKAEMLKVKDMYKRILSHQPLLEMDSEEEEDIPDDATESDLSTSDED
ncbi:uncharacterized protein LOC102077695 isoform X2 [Oreochromis niloticus]|nr:uncharacterized protein LOC102077695 isoform X2 [Oreochromis niloticus]XP_025758883.1 uncharacterized protein LOC102077695 isoform X2 [Oreochromis niloticus]